MPNKRHILQEAAVLIFLTVIVGVLAVEKSQNIKSKCCVLPQHPANGRWFISTSTKLNPGQEIPSNTNLGVECNKYYEQIEKISVTCIEGSWSSEVEKISCSPICGIKPKLTSNNTKAHYPWNVAIYKNDQGRNVFQCTGSLISEKIILTAANCLTDPLSQILHTKFKVAAGKTSEKYKDPEDVEAQYADVENIYIPKKFKGAANQYVANVAIIITKSFFTMTDKIQPVCYDWGNNFVQEFDYLHETEYIAGPLKSEYFPDLKPVLEIKVSILNDTSCREMLTNPPERSDFKPFYTYDKVCSNYVNSDKVPMCRVNTGVGMVSENQEDNKYYLVGIVSTVNAVFFRSRSCDNQRWMLISQISKFSDFIYKKSKPYLPATF